MKKNVLLWLFWGATLPFFIGCQERWKKADEFVAQLSCDTSEEDFRKLVKSYSSDGLTLRRVEHLQGWDWVAIRKGTMIFVDYEKDFLVRAQITWIDAPMHRSFEEVTQLCSERHLGVRPE